MQKYIIKGGHALSGTVRVSGSKNAALPVIFASLVTNGISTVYNLPEIEDVKVAIELIRGFGAVVSKNGEATVINTRNLRYSVPPSELVCRLRASTYLIGACLSRFGTALLGGFGGCSFSDRPIDLHIYAMRSLGAKEAGEELVADKLIPSRINFSLASVGATVNALIACAATEGESVITGASREPHIDTLIDYLRGAGAEITVEGSSIRIYGTKLRGSSVRIPGDMIEAGTFLAISALSGGKVGVLGARVCELDSFLFPFTCAGMVKETKAGAHYLGGRAEKPVEITTAPYPAFPTDLQPIAAPLLALNMGGTITETVWRARFGYLNELNKMGLNFKLAPSRAEIYRSQLKPAATVAPDLRGGAALVIAALFAHGESVIENAELLLRGYERLEEKLRYIGADIKLLETT